LNTCGMDRSPSKSGAARDDSFPSACVRRRRFDHEVPQTAWAAMSAWVDPKP
jgi:hypothetical protein